MRRIFWREGVPGRKDFLVGSISGAKDLPVGRISWWEGIPTSTGKNLLVRKISHLGCLH